MRRSRRQGDKHGLDDDRRTLIHRYMVDEEGPPEPELNPPTLISKQPRQQVEPLVDHAVLESEVQVDPGAALGALDRYMIGLTEALESCEEGTQPALSHPSRYLVGLARPPESELIGSAALEPKVPSDPTPPLVDLQPAAPPPERHEGLRFQLNASRRTLDHVGRLCAQLTWARDESSRRRERLAAARPQGTASRAAQACARAR